MTRYDVVCLFYNDSRGWGDDGGARDCERGPQNRRGVAAACPGFEYISMLIYYISVV